MLCSVRVCVCHVCLSVTFVDSVKTNKHIFKSVSPSGSHTILVFLYQKSWQYANRFITIVAGKWPSLLMAGNNDEVYDKEPQRYAEDTVTQ